MVVDYGDVPRKLFLTPYLQTLPISKEKKHKIRLIKTYADSLPSASPSNRPWRSAGEGSSMCCC